MADLAWLAPIQHKDIKASKSHLAINQSIQISSRPGSARSVRSFDDDDYFYRSSATGMQDGVADTKWRPHKPPMSALKGAWSYQQHSRPSSPRPSSPGRNDNDTMTIYNLARSQHGHLDSNLNGQSLGRPLSGRMQHMKLHVEGADSINRKRENDIDNLQSSFGTTNHSRHYSDEVYQNAEFVQLSFTNRNGNQGGSAYSRPLSARSATSPASRTREQRDATFDDVGNNSNSRKDGNHRRNDKEGDFTGAFHKRNKLSRTNLSRMTPSKNNLNKSRSRQGKEHEFVIEDLEKDQNEFSTANVSKQEYGGGRYGRGNEVLNGATNKGGKNEGGIDDGENGGEVPTIVVDDIERPFGEVNKFKKPEDVVEARRRKLKMKMKHANAFKQLFDATRAQSLRAELDLDRCYNPEDIKVAKTEEKKEIERDKKLEAIAPDLPAGLPLKSLKELKATKTKTPTYATVAEAGQFMMSPESLQVMKDTLGEKRQQLFGEQPWLLGRLALSKETSRFELPMDLRILSKISPMEYLTRFTVISSRRRNLYKSTFQKIDKDRDGWISHKDLVKALKDIHVNYIDENEIDELCRMLSLGDGTNEKYDNKMFCGIAAFSERLVLHMRKKFGKSDPFGKEKLEDADFDNMKWKLRTVDVNPPLMNVLQVL